jgi:SAM-dependent methyltransferase
VFDFGSGCGRQARQLMQQAVQPRRYVGIDIHREMVAWCQAHLSTINPNFHFLHHNVHNPGLAPNNSQQLTAVFPVASGEFTLVNAHSVFTHIYQHQAEYYLREVERILTADGIARTTWFFFDRGSYPWLEKWQNCLFVNAEDPTNAVIYDWKWFLEAIAPAGLAVRQTIFPGIPGHQWQVFLEKRRDESIDRFPSAENAAEWLCGASVLQRDRYLREIERRDAVSQNLESQIVTLRSASLGLSHEVEALRNSWSWRWASPLRKLADLLPKRERG